MKLAFQSYKHGRETAMLKIVWSLCTAALETYDLVHRDWIMTRFAKIAKFGNNYGRAAKALQAMIENRSQSRRLPGTQLRWL